MPHPNDRIAAETPRPNGHVADLVDDHVHRLLDAGRAAEVERHCNACPACRAALDEARRRLAALQAAPPAEASELLVQKTIARVDAHRQARRRRWRRFLWTAGVGLAASVALLAWLNVAAYNLAATPYDLVVVGQRDLLAATDGSLRIVLRDARTLAPLAGVPVKVQMLNRASGKTADLAAFATDAHGGGEPRFTVPDWPDADCELRVVAQTAGAPEAVAQAVTVRRSFKVMLSTDKPVYQPGQTIHARTLALRQPDLHPVADQPETFSVVDPKGNVIFKQEGKTSRYGITAADCPLDTEILEGPYTVVCKTGDVESKMAVDVKKYVLPKFKLAVTPDKPFYKPGDTVKLAVQADYFFGKPVADAAVAVDVAEDVADRKPIHLTGRTDAKGAASFDYPVRPPTNASDPAHVHFQATVVDPAGQKQAASAEPAVSAWPARIDVLPEAGELVQGVPNTIYVLVTRLDGTPLEHAHVTLTNLTDNRGPGDKAVPYEADADDYGAASIGIIPSGQFATWGSQMRLEATVTDEKGERIAFREVFVPVGPSSDFLVRTDRAVYRGGDTMTLTAVGGGGPVFVDLIREGQTLLTETIEMSNGEGRAVVDLAPDVAGTVQVVAYRLDVKGYPVRKTRVVYVQPADQVHIAATLDPGKKEYKPGERPMLHLKLTDKGGKPCPGAVTLAGVDEAVFSVLPQRPGTEQSFYTVQEDLLTAVNRIHAWSPADAGSPRYQQALFAAASRVDASYQGPMPPPLIDEFDKVPAGPPIMPAPRPPFVGESLAVQPAAVTHSLLAQTYQAKVQATQELRTQRLDWIKRGWAMLAVAVIVVGVLAFWLFAPTSLLVKGLVTGYVVIPFLLLALATVLVQEGFAPAGAKFTAAVSAARMSTDAEAMAPAAGVPNAPGNIFDLAPQQAAHGAAPEPRVRQMFPETLLWRPEIVTDDEGNATLPLDLADSITTWRLSASAVSGDGKLGAMQLPVRVFRDFFVDLDLPVALTRGDEVGVPVVVYNYLDKPQTVTVALADDPANWFTRLDAAEQRLELGPNEVRSVHFRLKVEKVGNWTLTVKARGADDADAVKRPIEVVADGRRVEEAVNGTLEKPADVTLTLPEDYIPGSARALVKIYPSSFSQLVEGLDGIFRMPSGCFEQTSSTTYPNVLALDYLKRTGGNAPTVRANAEQFIHYGYQRLLGFEVPGGGFEWFGQSPANRALTAYGLMEFTDMARVHDVDPRVIQRTRGWLLAQRRPDGSWDPEDHKMHDDAVGGATPDDARLAETAYVAWAVFGDPASAGQAAASFAYLKRTAPDAVKDPHTLALVCNALLAADANNADAAPYLDRLEAMKKFSDDGKFAWWEQPAGARTTFYGAGRSGAVETTALATLALLRSGRNPDAARRALAWLVSQKDPHGAWYTTQATVLALKALLAGTNKPLGDGERVVEVRLDGEPVETVRIPADQADVLKQVDLSARLKPGKQIVTVSEARGAAVGFQASFWYNVPDAGPATKEFLSVKLDYDRTELPVGAQVEATAQVGNRTRESAPMVMVVLPVPPGFTASADDFREAMKANPRIARFQVRGRDVLLYLTGLDPAESVKATYRLRATTPVKAAAPGARAYEYYDPDKQGSSPATRFTVNARE